VEDKLPENQQAPLQAIEAADIEVTVMRMKPWKLQVQGLQSKRIAAD